MSLFHGVRQFKGKIMKGRWTRAASVLIVMEIIIPSTLGTKFTFWTRERCHAIDFHYVEVLPRKKLDSSGIWTRFVKLLKWYKNPLLQAATTATQRNRSLISIYQLNSSLFLKPFKRLFSRGKSHPRCVHRTCMTTAPETRLARGMCSWWVELSQKSRSTRVKRRR